MKRVCDRIRKTNWEEVQWEAIVGLIASLVLAIALSLHVFLVFTAFARQLWLLFLIGALAIFAFTTCYMGLVFTLVIFILKDLVKRIYGKINSKLNVIITKVQRRVKQFVDWFTDWIRHRSWEEIVQLTISVVLGIVLTIIFFIWLKDKSMFWLKALIISSVIGVPIAIVVSWPLTGLIVLLRKAVEWACERLKNSKLNFKSSKVQKK